MSRRISRATAVTARIAAAAVVLGCASVVLPASASAAPASAAPASAAAVAASPARLFTPAASSCTPAAPDYVTRPDLRPVGACTTGNIALTAPGYLFTAPNGQGRGGPTIYADDGSVVWTKPRSVGDEQNFQVLNVGGRKLLAYYHGAWLVFGVETRGEFVLNGGNPTACIDPDEVPAYPVGTMPDRNFRGLNTGAASATLGSSPSTVPSARWTVDRGMSASVRDVRT